MSFSNLRALVIFIICLPVGVILTALAFGRSFFGFDPIAEGICRKIMVRLSIVV